MKKIAILYSGLALLLFGCPPDGDPIPPPTIKDQLIGTWRINELEIDSEPRTINSQNQLTFKEDEMYTMTLPELSFFPRDGNWVLTNSDTKISINDGEYTFNINSLEDKDLTLTLEYENFKEDPITYKLALKK
uniref:Lipocalin family protein n=1 Tax=Roseihalotalea indica TaxID=2867963 RepID=A0AA49JIH3_9BACT|nr:lipocalin family protein [Tunicatimonas sp. TK19036]